MKAFLIKAFFWAVVGLVSYTLVRPLQHDSNGVAIESPFIAYATAHSDTTSATEVTLYFPRWMGGKKATIRTWGHTTPAPPPEPVAPSPTDVGRGPTVTIPSRPLPDPTPSPPVSAPVSPSARVAPQPSPPPAAPPPRATALRAGPPAPRSPHQPAVREPRPSASPADRPQHDGANGHSPSMQRHRAEQEGRLRRDLGQLIARCESERRLSVLRDCSGDAYALVQTMKQHGVASETASRFAEQIRSRIITASTVYDRAERPQRPPTRTARGPRPSTSDSR